MNVSSDGDDVTVAGKLFDTRAAATGKAPTVDKRVEGTLSASVNDELETPPIVKVRYTLGVTGEIRRG